MRALNRPGSFIWVAVAGILVFLGMRLHNLDAIPLFIDGSIAIQRSEDILNDVLLRHGAHGKFLLPYYLLPFQPHVHAVWVTRASLLLVLCLGVASSTAIAKRYGGRAAGGLVLLLFAFSPMLFFFDRFILADTMLHAVLTTWVWTLFLVLDRPQPNFALAVGSAMLFSAAVLVKASALFLLPLPFVMALFLRTWPLRERLKVLAVMYLTVGALVASFIIVLATRQVDYFGNYGNLGASSQSDLFSISRPWINLLSMLEAFYAYHGVAFTVCLISVSLLAIRFKPAVMLSLLAGAFGYALALAWLGRAGVHIRYYIPLLPLLLVAASIAMSALDQAVRARFKRPMLPFVYALLALWLFTFSAPFIWQLQTRPSSVSLARGDWIEYISYNSSGFGIPELAEYLGELAADSSIVVEGAFAGCYTLRLYLPLSADVRLQCSNVMAGERRAPYLNARLPSEADKHARFYLVLETSGFVSREELTTVQLALLAEFPRPDNISDLQLFEVAS